MAGKVKSLVSEKISPSIEEMGYEVVDIEYIKTGDGMELTFYIDSDNGVNIDDCEKVSKVIDPLLDQLNPTDDQPYTLCVSSPGIDRPLKSERDFKRNQGKEVSLTLFAKQNGQKVFEGLLQGFDKETVTLIVEGENITFSRGQVAHIVPIIKF